MDENNQIEGMAKVLYGKYCGNDKCGNCKEPSCVSYIFAEKLYNAGYRKQSETAREILIYLYEKIGNVAVSDSELIKYLAKEYGVEVEE